MTKRQEHHYFLTLKTFGMKHTFILLSATFLAGSISTFAQQDSSGIFNTVDDYKNGRLTYAINYKTEKQKIKDYLLLDASSVKVKHGGQTHLLNKHNLYGYRDTKGHDYRFIGDNTYRILNPREPIILYKYAEVRRDPAKNPPTLINRYYFSTNAENAPVSLTRGNLKKAFPENTKFHETIDKTFRSDDELTRFDKLHNTYTVVWLLERSESGQ
jgi:hypothetical protein